MSDDDAGSTRGAVRLVVLSAVVMGSGAVTMMLGFGSSSTVILVAGVAMWAVAWVILVVAD